MLWWDGEREKKGWERRDNRGAQGEVSLSGIVYDLTGRVQRETLPDTMTSGRPWSFASPERENRGHTFYCRLTTSEEGEGQFAGSAEEERNGKKSGRGSPKRRGTPHRQCRALLGVVIVSASNAHNEDVPGHQMSRVQLVRNHGNSAIAIALPCLDQHLLDNCVATVSDWAISNKMEALSQKAPTTVATRRSNVHGCNRYSGPACSVPTLLQTT